MRPCPDPPPGDDAVHRTGNTPLHHARGGPPSSPGRDGALRPDRRCGGPRGRAKGLALAAVLGPLALVYGVALGALYVKQEALLFQPRPLPADHRPGLGQDVHVVPIEVPGATLTAWHLRLPAPRGVVFYLHGNGGNLAEWFTRAEFYRQANVDLFMLDYRGYGQSTGRIESEAQLHADVRAAWDAVAPRYQGRLRAVFGRSLGSGLAVALAREVQPELTVLVSPYRSLRAVAAEHYPWVPGALLRYPLATEAWIGELKGPVLMLHGSADTLIPPQHSADLQAVAPRAQRLVLEGARHNDVERHPAYWPAVLQAIDAAAPAPGRADPGGVVPPAPQVSGDPAASASTR
jgi:alpha-beta hydrolase superfamily lysophospholipase